MLQTLSVYGMQQYTISSYRVNGKVIDTLGNPIVNAMVVFGRQKGSVNHIVTDSSGTFHLNLSDDKYSLSVSHVAFREILDSIQLHRDTILLYSMVPIAYNLDEVTVSTDYVRQRGSGFTAMVKGNPLAKGRSALSFINTFSIVRGISVNNRPSVVYINGRELKMNPSEIINFLATIPAENIEKVRVKTMTGASSKNAGLQSAIEISLANSDKDYYSGMVNVSPSYIYGTGALLGNAGASFGYFNRRLSSLTYLNFYGIHNDISKYESIINGTHKENNEDRHSFYGITLDQSLVYDINKNHSIGVGMNLFCKPSEKNSIDFFSNDAYSFAKEREFLTHREDIFLNYKYTFGERRSNLSIKADILNSGKDYREEYFDSYENDWQRYSDKALNAGISADVHLFVTDEADFTFGVSYTSMTASRKYSSYANSERFGFSEGNIGAYAEFYTPLFNERLDLTAGLRFEQYFADVMGHAGKKHIRNWDLFPTLDITYTFKRNGYYLSLMYDKGIYRPYMSDYLPFVTRIGEKIYDVGGITEIQPEYERSVSLVQTLARHHTIGLSYNWTDKFTDAIYQMEEDTLYSVWSNTGTIHDIGMYVSSKFWIVKNIMTANIFVEGNYILTANNSNIISDLWAFKANLGLGWMIPKGWTIVANGRWNSPSLTPTSKTSGYWAAGLNVQKNFKKGWKLSLYLNDVINSGHLTKISVPDQILRQKITMNRASIVFSMTYMFKMFSGKKASYINGVRERSINN